MCRKYPASLYFGLSQDLVAAVVAQLVVEQQHHLGQLVDFQSVVEPEVTDWDLEEVIVRWFD